jgi:hypothetical protein
MRNLLAVAILGFPLMLAACGGGSNGNSGLGTQPTAPLSIQGTWEVVALSTVNPTAAYPDTLIEANLSQTEGSVSAGVQSVALVPFFSQGVDNWGIANPNVNVCGGASETMEASITNGTSLSLTLTESGPSGTYTVSGTAMISSDGKSMTGNYSASAACGYPDDGGTFIGTLVPSLSGKYAATFSDGSTANLTVSEDANYNLQINGIEQGQAFTLGGEAVGGGFSVTGNVPGVGAVTYQGIYLTAQLTTLIPGVNNIQTVTGDFVTLGSDSTIGIVVPN